MGVICVIADNVKNEMGNQMTRWELNAEKVDKCLGTTVHELTWNWEQLHRERGES